MYQRGIGTHQADIKGVLGNAVTKGTSQVSGFKRYLALDVDSLMILVQAYNTGIWIVLNVY